MFKLFIIPVAIAFSIQIIHSILTKGGRFTLEFFGSGLLFGFAREFLMFTFHHSYDFPHMPIKLLNVPIFIPVGWVFTFYLAHEFVNKLIEPKTVKDYKDFITFAAFFSTFICISIETAAMNMNWWSTSFYINDNIAAFALISGWFSTSAIFFLIYFFVKKKLPPEQKWLVLILLIAAFMTAFTWFVLLLQIIVLLPMMKFNKELTIILIIFVIINSCTMTAAYLSIANGVFVTITFISIFIYTFIKLRYMDVKHQISIKE